MRGARGMVAPCMMLALRGICRRLNRSWQGDNMGTPVWDIQHVKGDLHLLVNTSGQTAYNVEAAALGPVVISGRRDWKMSVPEVAAGDAIRLLYKKAWGSGPDNEAAVEVGYHLLHNDVLHWSTVRIPLP